MNKQEAIRKEKERYDKNFYILNSLPDNLDIDFISDRGKVFINPYKKLNDLYRDSLDMTINYYFLDYDSICISYDYQGINIAFYCEEINKTENYLESVGAKRV